MHGASTAPVVAGRALQGKSWLSGRLTSGHGARSLSVHSPSPGYLREKNPGPGTKQNVRLFLKGSPVQQGALGRSH